MNQVAPNRRGENLRSLFEEYIHECTYSRRRSPETIRGYKQVFDTFTKLCPSVTLESLSHRSLTELFSILETRERVVGKGIIKKGVKKSTIVTYISKLHSFFEWMQQRGYIDENPVRKMARVTATYDTIESLRKPEIEKIRAAIDNHSHDLLHMKRDRAMVSILIFCGLRRGELLGLAVTDVNLEKQQLTIRKETSKSKRTRMLPLNQQTVMHLEDYLSERNRRTNGKNHPFYKTPTLFVALHQDRGLSKDGLKHWVVRLIRLSGVKFHLHQFRHTFACNAATNGANAIILQRLLGHTDLRMTQRYVRSLSVDDLRSVVDVLSFDSLA